MPQFASQTTVPVEKSRAEIERLVTAYGASAFATGWNGQHATVQFQFRDRVVRFKLMLPDREDKRFQRSPGGRRTLTPAGRLAAWEQACRQRWRALLLSIKAKLEAVQSGISIFDAEFLAYVVNPMTGQTIGEQIAPQLAQLGKADIPLLGHVTDAGGAE